MEQQLDQLRSRLASSRPVTKFKSDVNKVKSTTIAMIVIFVILGLAILAAIIAVAVIVTQKKPEPTVIVQPAPIPVSPVVVSQANQATTNPAQMEIARTNALVLPQQEVVIAKTSDVVLPTTITQAQQMSTSMDLGTMPVVTTVTAAPPQMNPFVPNPPLLRVDPTNDPNEACINRVFVIKNEPTGIQGLVWPRGRPNENTESGELARKIVDYLKEYPHDPAVQGLIGAQANPVDPRYQYPSYAQFDFADLDLGVMNGSKGQLKRAARTTFYVDASQDRGNCDEQVAIIQLQSFVGFTPALQARNYAEYLALVKRFRENEQDTRVGVSEDWEDQDPWSYDIAEGRVYEDYIAKQASIGPVLDDDAIVQKPLYPITTAEILPPCPDTFCYRDGPQFSSVCEQ